MIVLRVAKSDAAYLYQLLESYEGLANYSTLTLEKELAYRDIVLHEAPDLRKDLEAMLEYMRAEISFELLDKNK